MTLFISSASRSKCENVKVEGFILLQTTLCVLVYVVDFTRLQAGLVSKAAHLRGFITKAHGQYCPLKTTRLSSVVSVRRLYAIAVWNTAL
jgi:hypothetical protein